MGAHWLSVLGDYISNHSEREKISSFIFELRSLGYHLPLNLIMSINDELIHHVRFLMRLNNLTVGHKTN